MWKRVHAGGLLGKPTAIQHHTCAHIMHARVNSRQHATNPPKKHANTAALSIHSLQGTTQPAAAPLAAAQQLHAPAAPSAAPHPPPPPPSRPADMPAPSAAQLRQPPRRCTTPVEGAALQAAAGGVGSPCARRDRCQGMSLCARRRVGWLLLDRIVRPRSRRLGDGACFMACAFTCVCVCVYGVCRPILTGEVPGA